MDFGFPTDIDLLLTGAVRIRGADFFLEFHVPKSADTNTIHEIPLVPSTPCVKVQLWERSGQNVTLAGRWLAQSAARPGSGALLVMAVRNLLG